MTEKQEQPKKSILKKRWFWVLVFFFCVFLASNMDGTPATNTPAQQEVKKDVVQERMDHIAELMQSEVSEFEKVEKIEDNVIGIFFTDTPDMGIADSIDSTTRGQAVNLSNDVNGVASVKTFVGGNAVMYCTATKGQVNDCIDYR